MSEQGARYPVGTIYEMAAIPKEAQHRFLTELPSMLAEVRRMREAKAVIEQCFDGMELDLEIAGGVVWVDDDKGEINTTIHMPDGDAVSAKRKIAAGL